MARCFLCERKFAEDTQKKIQVSLSHFFGGAPPEPVLLDVGAKPRHRPPSAILMQKMKEAEERLKQLQALWHGDAGLRAEVARKKQLRHLRGRPAQRVQADLKLRKDNRKAVGHKTLGRDLPASVKLSICLELKEAQPCFAALSAENF